MSQTSGPHWVPLQKPFVQGYEAVSRLFAKAAEQSLVFSIWDEKSMHELSFCSLILYDTTHRRFLWDKPYIPFLFRLLSSPSNTMQKREQEKPTGKGFIQEWKLFFLMIPRVDFMWVTFQCFQDRN